MKKALLLPALLVFWFNMALSQPATFNYTGAMQTYTVPGCCTQVTILCAGAEGGFGGASPPYSATQDKPGNGGIATVVLSVVGGQVLNVFVGGVGANGTQAGGGLGGWNGGGQGGAGYSWSNPFLWWGGGGGGASDVRVGGIALANRVVVGGAGAGGGFNYFACCDYDRGGAGGGLIGKCGWSGNAQCSGTGPGRGGSQVAGGAAGTWGGYCSASAGVLGVGGSDQNCNPTDNAGGGGGGGYYGGGGGCWSGGGGGSSFVAGVGIILVISNVQGTQTGNGVVTITPNQNGLPMTLTMSQVNPPCNNPNGGSATVSVTGGNPPFTYKWEPGGQTNATATGLSVGTYTVVVTSALGCQDSAYVTLTSSAPTATAAVLLNPTCFGSSNGSAGCTATGGTPAYTYQWSPSGGTNAIASGLSAGSYTITVTDAIGCKGTAVVSLTSPPQLTATVTATPITCNGGSNGTATVTAGGGTPVYNYSWAPIGGNGQMASNLTVGSYTVTVTDANGCTATAVAVITQPAPMIVSIGFATPVSCFQGNNGSASATVTGGTPVYNYIWSPLGGNSQTASNLTAGVYSVSVTDANGCTGSASVTITQPSSALTVTMLTPSEVYCNGDSTGRASVSVGGGTPNYTYQWNDVHTQTTISATGLAAGNYTCTVTDAGGCIVSTDVQITQPTAIVLNTAAFPTTCNDGDDGQANVIPAGGVPPYTYSWSNTSTTPAIASLTAGNYTITVIDSHGCIDKATATVTQPPPIVVSFSADTLRACAPLCTDFSDMSNDPNYALDKWHWEFGDGDTDNVSSPRHCFTSPGIYGVTLTVVDNKGCRMKLTIPNMIDVYTFPVPMFEMSPQPTTILNPDIQFSDKSTDQYGPISSWSWNFNDPLSGLVNDLSTHQNPMHQYVDTGTFCVNLAVTNLHGCKDSITECLVISNNYSLYIPDGFSPNGDGVNDVFLPKGEAVQQYSMYIFDRWGTMIYNTNDINKGWDGTINGGKVCPIDTYVYEITVTDSFNNTHSYIGKVTLIK